MDALAYCKNIMLLSTQSHVMQMCITIANII